MGTVCMPQDLAPPMIHSPSEHSSPDVHRPRRSGSTAAPSELATRMQTQLPSGLATWLPDLVGREDLSVEDLEDMFILIQVLSVAHPASVDLTWYMTDEALSHPDLTNRNQQVLFAGLAESRISLSDSQRRGIAAGDPWVAAEVAELIWKSRGESNALDSEHVARASYEDPCRIFRPESAKFRISPGGSYDLANPGLAVGLRWLLTLLVGGCSQKRLGRDEIWSKRTEQFRNAMYQHEKTADHTLPGELVVMIASGDLYEAAIELLSLEESTNSANSNRKFAFFLQSRWNNHPTLLNDPTRLTDLQPFDETAHGSVILLLMQEAWSRFSPRSVENHLKQDGRSNHDKMSHHQSIRQSLINWINSTANFLRRSSQQPFRTTPPTSRSSTATTSSLSSRNSTGPLFLENWVDITNLTSDVRDGHAFSCIAIAYRLGAGPSGSGLDVNKIYPRRRPPSTSSNVSPQSVNSSQTIDELDLVHRVANLSTFESICGAEAGLGRPPWMAEELAAASFAKNSDGSQSEGDAILETAIVGFLIEVFQHISHLAPRPLSRKTVRVSRKSVKEFRPHSSSKGDNSLQTITISLSQSMARHDEASGSTEDLRTSLGIESGTPFSADREVSEPGPQSPRLQTPDNAVDGSHVQYDSFQEKTWGSHFAPAAEQKETISQLDKDSGEEHSNISAQNAPGNPQQEANQSSATENSSRVLLFQGSNSEDGTRSAYSGTRMHQEGDITGNMGVDSHLPRNINSSTEEARDGNDYTLLNQSKPLIDECHDEAVGPFEFVCQPRIEVQRTVWRSSRLSRPPHTAPPEGSSARRTKLPRLKTSVSAKVVETVSNPFESERMENPPIVSFSTTPAGDSTPQHFVSLPLIMQDYRAAAPRPSERDLHSKEAKRKRSTRIAEHHTPHDSTSDPEDLTDDSPPLRVDQFLHESEDDNRVRAETEAYDAARLLPTPPTRPSVRFNPASPEVISSRRHGAPKGTSFGQRHGQRASRNEESDSDSDGFGRGDEPPLLDVDKVLRHNRSGARRSEGGGSDTASEAAYGERMVLVDLPPSLHGMPTSEYEASSTVDVSGKKTRWPRPATGRRPRAGALKAAEGPLLREQEGWMDEAQIGEIGENESDDKRAFVAGSRAITESDRPRPRRARRFFRKRKRAAKSNLPDLAEPLSSVSTSGAESQAVQRQGMAVESENLSVVAPAAEAIAHTNEQTPPRRTRPSTRLMSYPLPESDHDAPEGKAAESVQWTMAQEEEKQAAWERSQARSKIVQKRLLQQKRPKEARKSSDFDRSSQAGLEAPQTVRDAEQRRKAHENETHNPLLRAPENKPSLFTSPVKQAKPHVAQFNTEASGGNLLTPRGKLRSPQTQSNRQLIKNALKICLAGAFNDSVKEQVMQVLSTSSSTHFIILFRGVKNHAFKGLFSYEPGAHTVERIFPLPPRLDVDGNDEDAAPTAASMLRLPPLDARTIAVTAAVVAAGGLNGRERPQSAASGSGGGAIGVPGRLDEADVAEYYKFDSGSRTFKALHTRSFGRSVHAVATRGEFGRRKAVAPTTVGARR